MKDTYKKINRQQYEILRLFPESVQKEYVSQVISLSKDGDSILDIGFGSGLFLIPLANLNKKAEIHGIDYSKKMYEAVSKLVNNKAKIFFGDILKFKGSYNIVHFKAILHCFDFPEKALDKIKSLSKKGGYIVTGDENSQIEDRIEQIFNSPIVDKDLELLFEYYFSLRVNLGKPFIERKYPAGNATKAVEYICRDKKFTLLKVISNKALSWERKYQLNDLLYSIRYGTYNVFAAGLSLKDRDFIYMKMSKFAEEHKLNMTKKRSIPANFRIFIIKHNL
jgi:ubiquinone/menaquinone biosynthesis C-methylase UbiE